MASYNFTGDKLDYDSKYHDLKFNKLVDEDYFYKTKSKVAKTEYFSFLFNQNAKVLEFGCGVGQNLGLIKNKFGFDINKNLYPYLNKKGITTFNKISDMPNNYFDEILLSQVLEHLENPIETLKELKDKLKVGGKIRIVVPKVSYRKVPFNSTEDGHIWGWGFYELNYLLNICGFKVIYNKGIYRRGTELFRKVSRLSFGLYLFLTRLLGLMTYSFDIMVVAVKK